VKTWTTSAQREERVVVGAEGNNTKRFREARPYTTARDAALSLTLGKGGGWEYRPGTRIVMETTEHDVNFRVLWCNTRPGEENKKINKEEGK